MSFIEFLKALNQKNLAKEIINHDLNKEFSETLHDKLLKLLGEYLAIGGLPRVLSQWINAKDVNGCTLILEDIKNAYEQDFAKYAKNKNIKYVELLFRQIPSLICQHFKYSQLTTSFRKRELEPALVLLEKACIFKRVFNSAASGIPLGAQADFNKFKLLPLDIGLNQNILGLDLKEWFLNPLQALVNKGAVAESFIGQEILAYSNPHHKQTLYYWHREERGSHAEVDYLMAKQQNIIPIKINSGHRANLQSMRLFLQAHPKVSYGIRFSIHNYSSFENIQTYPLYAVAAVMEDKERLLEFLSQ